jgi:plasmid stability protein
MAVLNIRNLPDKVHAKLRMKAAKAGHSMEAEAREIIAAAFRRELPALSPKELQRAIAKIRGKKGSGSEVDDFLANRRRETGE